MYMAQNLKSTNKYTVASHPVPPPTLRPPQRSYIFVGILNKLLHTHSHTCKHIRMHFSFVHTHGNSVRPRPPFCFIHGQHILCSVPYHYKWTCPFF